MSENLTHWKKLVNPDYLGSYALEPGKDMILTIKSVTKQEITGTGGKKEVKPVMYFEESVKPLIVNATNFKTIKKLLKTPFIEHWIGKKIIVYQRLIDAFGEKDVEAIRIRDYQPKVELLDIESSKVILLECTTLAELQTAWSKLPKAEASNTELMKLKDKLKTKLK